MTAPTPGIDTTRATVVVGAASGMGEAVARRFKADGRRLVLADRDAGRLESLAGALAADDFVVCDTTDGASVQRLADGAGDTVALVITAGLSPTMGEFRPIMEVNLAGTTRVLRAFEPHLGDGASVVCFASIAGHMSGDPSAEILAELDDPDAPDLAGRVLAAGAPDDPGTAYSLSKYGVLRLARRTGTEWGPNGVRVYSLSPGIIDTPMGRQEFEHQPFMAEMIKTTPIGRLGRPEEIANVVAFLCSDAASYMTACDVLVDGGFVGQAR